MSAAINLKKQLGRYKEQLANLSRRNRELYFKESKGTSLSLTKPPFAKNALIEDSKKDFAGMCFGSAEFTDLLKGNDVNLHDFFLLDYYKEKEAAQKISNRLDRVRLADDKFQREFGISGAWVLGPFLCWRTSMNSPIEDLLITPLFKVPVDLYKNKKKQLNLKCETESLNLNPTFRLAIKQAFGIEFPENLSFESTQEAIESVISILNKADKNVIRYPTQSLPKAPGKFKIIKDESGEIIERVPVKIEEVLTQEELEIYKKTTGSDFLLLDLVYLDQLNASRAVLINDYDGIIENGLNHSILNELFNGTSNSFDTPVDRSKLRELDSYKEISNHFVVDIDSTQHRAIDKATKSKAIVIQGPPGSGKSQTIVNLIADYLSKGKKVLFVSEKRPALDVVFNRMKGANIENQSVLIHSSELNKSELYKSFLELANVAPCEEDQKSWLQASENLDRVKNEINLYADSLQELHKVSGLKVQELILLSNTVDREAYSPSVAQAFSNLSYQKIEALCDYVNQIQELLKKCNDFKSSPWIFKKPNILPTADLKHSLSTVHTKIKESISEIDSAVGKINNINFYKDTYVAEVTKKTELPKSSFKIDSISGVFNQSPVTIQRLTELQVYLQSLQKIMSENKQLSSDVKNNLDIKLADQIADYYKLPKGPVDWLSSAFWSYRKLRKHYCENWNGTDSQFTAYSKYTTALNSLKKQVSQLSGDAKIEQSIEFDSLTKLAETQSQELGDLKLFINRIENLVRKEKLDSILSNKANLHEAISDINELVLLENKTLDLTNWIKDQTSHFTSYLTVIPQLNEFKSVESWTANLLERINDLQVFDEAELVIKKAEAHTDEKQLHEKFISHFYNLPGNWSTSLMSSILQFWVDESIQTFPSLRGFDRQKMDLAYKEFLKSVENHQINSRLAITQAFASRWNSPSADKSGLGLLAKESTKQRKVLSPREIMEKGALKTMLQLKACWLMSPLSISQILPLESGLFDVIIFDEASQVRVEDAIPSIYRASTMIVVGDDKQMPPTAFFSGGSTDDDDEEGEDIAPSVLDLASQVYPSVLLEWHYRSRSEALIAFSNRAFYGGRLIAAPNPQTLTSSGAINFHRVDNGFFSFKHGNVTEADTVIENLIKELQSNPNQSFGIIAMGVSQASALQEALEKKMNSDSKVSELIEKAMQFKHGDADAGLFIKNLENVQGDERDVILLSVGYAPPTAGKKLRIGFGPLSMKGGGRRLNVAVTRAKNKMHVFCSFSPSELPTGEDTFSKNPDLCYFGRYLKYAEAVSNGRIEVATGILDTFPMSGVITSRKSSRFSLDVKRRLVEKGYEVSSEIGTSGFYIDLAIHHPTLKSNFLVGIECDGAIFHSTPYARDRDKIRQSLLESRGWKIVRVWSQDWSADWKKEVLRLDLLIKDIQNKPDEYSFKKVSG
ncbi:MAG: AAA family ATPase [Bdellovibrionaceae bacterium]|nr:AAA family ATPase [Pseudobdellovibrionaceae bacterium]